MTPKQEAALREYLQEAIVPLIEQVLVKKLGQAMSFAAEELIQPKPAQQQEPVGYTSQSWLAQSTGGQFSKRKGICGDVPLYTSPPAQQQEPVYWQWRRKDQPWSLEYTFNSEVQVTTKDSERRALYTSPPASKPLTPREVELLDGMIEVQLHHAAQCDRIANRVMAEKQKGWDMERVELLRKLKAAHGIKGDA